MLFLGLWPPSQSTVYSSPVLLLTSWSLQVRAAYLVAEKLLKCDFISIVLLKARGPRSFIYILPIWFYVPLYLWNEYSLQSPHNPIPGTDQKIYSFEALGGIKYFFYYLFLIFLLVPVYFKVKLLMRIYLPSFMWQFLILTLKQAFIAYPGRIW